jgi:hypothetical protein
MTGGKKSCALYIDGAYIKDYHTIAGVKCGGWNYNRLGTRQIKVCKR